MNRMITKWRLATQLAVAFGSIVALVSLKGLVSVHALTDAAKATDGLYRSRLTPALVLADINTLLWQARGYTSATIGAATVAEVSGVKTADESSTAEARETTAATIGIGKENLDKLTTVSREIDRLWKEYSAVAKTPAEQDLAERFADQLGEYRRQRETTVAAVAKGNFAGALDSFRLSEPKVEQASATLLELIDLQKSLSRQETERAQQAGRANRTLMVVLMALSLVLCGAAGLAIHSDLRRKTDTLSARFEAMLRGDLRSIASSPLTVEPGANEMGRMIHQSAAAMSAVVDVIGDTTATVTALAEGDFTRRMTVEAPGDLDALKSTVNVVSSNLARQIRDIAEVTTAVATGDLTRKITVDAQGELLALKDTVNTMVGQLDSFASEVTRVAREVGTEGKLGGQAEVPGVSGVWKDLTDSVNYMAANLTDQVRSIADVTTAVANGDLAGEVTVDARGEILELRDTINAMVKRLNAFASEVTRVAREVGTEGKLGGQAEVLGVSGVWKDLTDNVNYMAGNLTDQVRNIAEVAAAVAQGDLTREITVTAEGEILELKNSINTMVTQLRGFSDEVTRVAREVGTEGILGGQAQAPGVSGVWKDLTDNVNYMAGNLTAQVRNIADVTTAVARGDLSRTITVDARGEILQLKNTINTMVDQLSGFAAEVTRVAREVGTEGKLGGQAEVPGVSGVWKGLTENVNSMASNLTDQVRNIAEVTTAVAQGDLTREITVAAQGEILELKNTINTMVTQLRAFSNEVTRVAREVGTEGRLGGQAQVPGVSGVWKDLTDNVNYMAGNLTAQVRNIADVTTAVARGDLSRKITVDAQGEILQLKDTINTMVDQLNSFASEVTRVAREVGMQGLLGGQAEVAGVAGTWRDLTENVNSMARNLTEQVRNIAEVTTAVAQGDLTRKITVGAQGEILELKETVNTMVDGLGSFAEEVTRVAREVGTEGKLGGQARVRGVAGTWKDLTDNVNSMASNLTNQVRNIAEVTTAVAQGDLTKKITVDAQGEIFELKDTVNTMVDQLSSFGEEVTRVAREVGTEGRLGGQARVHGVSGTWRDLTDSVNSMASNLTEQVRNIAEVTTAVARGDLNRKITVDARGEILELKDTVNTMVDQLGSFAEEVTRVAREVGTEGILGGQANVRGVAGTWKDLTDNVNSMASNLTNQVRNIAEVTTAVARGDLSRKITVDARGEILRLKDTVNTMVDQLSAFASEVTRVAREVGTEGMLGGQAEVPGVAGTWKDLTDNVNSMAANLTDQVRGIAQVVTAVAEGDLSRTLTVQARGEIATLADTINAMTGTLAVFADQVTTVAREVGVDGQLGGQAIVPGASGTWRDLTDNVNRLAENLTDQVRAIADVATAVTAGDLTRTITVEARGEVATLKDNINQMIGNLQETTRINTAQDWLNTNVARFGRLLQGQRDLDAVTKMVLSELCPLVAAQHGVFYIGQTAEDGNGLAYSLRSTYGYQRRKNVPTAFAPGQGLVGQAATEKKRIVISPAPFDYIQIGSGLGEAPPTDIVVLPLMFEDEVMGVLELASFESLSEQRLALLDQLSESMGVVLNTIQATARTEQLLEQSQLMSQELQAQQEDLRQTNEELQEKAQQLVDQNRQIEAKNAEVERGRIDLEEKAEQLAITSKYKSEFLANMSHELRAPLNSSLILSEMLAQNADGNLTPKQVEYAQTIHTAGSDLLGLITDILDLSKIEAGQMTLEITDVALTGFRDCAERNYRQIAIAQGLDYSIELAPDLPVTIQTDAKRVEQIIKNLLSNAFKFTETGGVRFSIEAAEEGWSRNERLLREAETVIAFAVSDTGVGIPEDKRRIIFEAFQQLDGTASRKYEGTGLGLSISREIAKLLGGEIAVVSEEGVGSTFTLYLPASYRPPARQPGAVKGLPPAPSAATTRDQTPGPAPVARPPAPSLDDDRESVQADDRVVLIVEDDASFAGVLLDLAREKGFKGIVALRGEEGLELARTAKPDAITLDVRLPDINGWTVLDRLKRSPSTRHIPVHVISVEPDLGMGRKLGAIACLNKPATREGLREAFDSIEATIEQRVHKLLVVEDDAAQRRSIVELIGNGDVETTAVATGKKALAALKKERFECMVLDLSLPDMTGFELIRQLAEDPQIGEVPIIVYTGRELTQEEEAELRQATETIIVKDARSPERLLDETALFLHRVEDNLPKAKQDMIRRAYETDPVLVGRKALVVDDDVRNVFAMVGLLEQQGMEVTHAESGASALKMLREDPHVDVVLMDIMMPEMDGYEAIAKIRRMRTGAIKDVPIIAVTARAMRGERERCIEAGASDYIAKPVDTEQLLSMLRVWLYR